VTSNKRANVPTAVGAAQPGDILRDAKLIDVQDNSTTLEAARAGRAAVLVLYRGAWCPHCNLALRTYQRDLVPALDRRGVALMAISPQRPDGSLSMQERNELTFTVLSDPGNQVATALGVLTEAGDETTSKLRAIGTDLTELNGDGTEAVPMPTVVVVDPAGVIRWIDVHTDHTNRTEVGDIIAAVTVLEQV
jgi:peroxiredoxin